LQALQPWPSETVITRRAAKVQEIINYKTQHLYCCIYKIQKIGSSDKLLFYTAAAPRRLTHIMCYKGEFGFFSLLTYKYFFLAFSQKRLSFVFQTKVKIS